MGEWTREGGGQEEGGNTDAWGRRGDMMLLHYGLLLLARFLRPLSLSRLPRLNLQDVAPWGQKGCQEGHRREKQPILQA